MADDRNNPYGIDFIVFGNAMQAIGSGPAWRNGNPEDTVITRVTHGDPGIVSVSQDGVTWYTFSDGPYADSFAPTASFRWDSANDVWAEELDPTRPVDPELNVDGMNVAQMRRIRRFAGDGFDIGGSGCNGYQYVRIEDDPRTSVTTETDAVADVSRACGDYKHPFPAGQRRLPCNMATWRFCGKLAHVYVEVLMSQRVVRGFSFLELLVVIASSDF